MRLHLLALLLAIPLVISNLMVCDNSTASDTSAPKSDSNAARSNEGSSSGSTAKSPAPSTPQRGGGTPVRAKTMFM